ncbi:hypothetical protein M8J76_004894 [Diaphorina citri]|nr:hypothetical protein M8J76_004894 [Diaphorina citri]
MDAIKKKMQAMKLEKDNAMDRALQMTKQALRMRNWAPAQIWASYGEPSHTCNLKLCIAAAPQVNILREGLFKF